MIRVFRRTRPSPARRLVSVLASAALGFGALTFPGADQAVAGVAVTASVPSRYAYAHGGAKSPSSCPRTSQVKHQCTLAEALARVAPGGSVLLATSGKAAKYEGNFVIGTAHTSQADPVTIAPAPGTRFPAVNGEGSGSVFTLKRHVFADIESVTMVNGDGTSLQGGGGVADQGTLTLTKVTISDCDGQVGGGVGVGPGANLTVTGSTFTSDHSNYFGGAINSGSVIGKTPGSGTVTVTDSTFSGDSSPRGGAIDSGDGGTGTLAVSGSTFSRDSASAHGGAIDTGDSGTGQATVTGSTFSHDSSKNGGAIDNADSGGKGTLSVTGSVFFDNSAADGAAIDNAERGKGTVTVLTSTFTANKATRQGSVIDSADAAGSGAVEVLNSTIDANLGRSAIDEQGGSVQIAGTILAGSMATCSRSIADGGYNLASSSVSGCGFTAADDLIGVNPRLGPLKHNGGATMTMVPSPTSPVLEQIPNPAVADFSGAGGAVALCPVPDQRGTSGYEAYGCAIGSVDPASGVPVVTSLSSVSGIASGGGAITISGGNFLAGATVRFGGTSASNVDVVSPTSITATVPALPASDSSLAVDVTVTSKNGLTSPYRTTAAYSYYRADWSAYLDGASHSSYNPAPTDITPGSITNLQPIWQWTPPPTTNSGLSFELSSPVVSGGVIYVGLEDGYLYAISEATRQILWSDFLGVEVATSCQGGTMGITSTAAIAADPSTHQQTVYVNAPDGYLYALNATTGATEWKSLVGIPGSLTGGPDNYYAWGSPTVANGKVYIGIASNCDLPLVRAGVLEISQQTGKRLEYWDSLPSNVVGASVWSSVAVLPDGDIAVATGNAVGNDQIPHAESIAVLNGTTLKLLGAWQIPTSQAIGDSDFGGSPTVFTADPHGVATPMVGACNKNGIYYAVRANDVDAGPLWERRMGVPTTGPESNECDAAAIWDGTNLIVGGGSITTIDGTQYNGSVQALNPTTGKPVWATGLPGWVVGSPSEDSAGVIAAPVLAAPGTGATGVYLLNASDGDIIGYISSQPHGIFAQPVFDGNDLLIGNQSSSLPLTEYTVTTPGQATPMGVSPGTADKGSTVTLTLTSDGGFTSPANVVVSSAEVEVKSVDIVNSTTASVEIEVFGDAIVGQELDVTLTEPDLTAYTCPSCLTIGPSA